MAISSGRNTSERNGRGIIKSPFPRFYQILSTLQEAWVAPKGLPLGGFELNMDCSIGPANGCLPNVLGLVGEFDRTQYSR